MQEFVEPLQQGLRQLSATLEWVAGQQRAQPQAVAAGAYDLLTAVGTLYLGWVWAQIAEVALEPCRFLDETGRLRKLALARVWMQRQMPLVDTLCRRVQCGNDGLLCLADAEI